MATTLALGFIAACAWGIHDFLIRYVTSRISVLQSLFLVLLFGALAQAFWLLFRSDDGLLPMATPGGLASEQRAEVLALAMATGLAYLVAGFGLYRAMQRGPVGLAAPLVASFPVFSLGLAAFNGAELLLGQMFAVACVVIGCGLVGRFAPEENLTGQCFPDRKVTAVYAVLSAAGFSLAFHLGQIASQSADELKVTFYARMTAVVVLAGMLTFRQRGGPRAGVLQWRLDLRTWSVLGAMGLLDGAALLAVLAAGNQPYPAFATVTASTFGIVTVLLAWRCLGERVAWLQGSGGLLAFAGIAYLSA